VYLFEPLERIIKGYLPAEKIELVRRAFVIARDAHEGQTRSSGEPYITHPVAGACIIAEMKLDHEAVMGALFVVGVCLGCKAIASMCSSPI